MVANGFDGVPWMMGGGAKHSANLGRVLAYAATSGGDGVITAGDLKVSQSSTPDNQVHVATGAVAIRNFYGNARSETYIARAPSVSDVTVGSTGSSGRSDLLVVRVDDPQYGGQAPSSLTDGPYVRPFLIPGVPNNTVWSRGLFPTEPMYAIARIDIPPNTSKITDGMIKNLRQLVLPREHAEVSMSSIDTTVGTPGVNPGYQQWNIPTPSFYVPMWATHVYAVSTYSGVFADNELHDMLIQTRFGQLNGDPQVIDIDNDMAGLGRWTRENFTVGVSGELSVGGMAGTTQPLATWIQNTRGHLEARPGTHLTHTVHFYERAI